MRYKDGSHDARKFLSEATRPKALTENEKFVAVQVLDPRELQRPCRCHLKGNEQQNCWSCQPVDRWESPCIDELVKEHAFSDDYKLPMLKAIM